MKKTGQRQFVKFLRTGKIDIAHRLAIVPPGELNQFVDERLQQRRRINTDGFSLVILEQDLSENGREYVLAELLNTQTEAGLKQAMTEGILLRLSPVLQKAINVGLLQAVRRYRAATTIPCIVLDNDKRTKKRLNSCPLR